jgi:hypothetical protein
MFLLTEYDDNKWIQDFQMSKYINIWHGFTIETFHYKEKHMIPSNIYNTNQNCIYVVNNLVDYVTLQWHQIVWTSFYVQREKRTLDQLS